ncbi:hypothetical protein ACA910_016945 [Epithemia clementina (nom. ined.)]
MSSWSLKQRNFLVTGGSNGIGLAVVREFLSCGAQTVIFCSRSEADDLLSSLQKSFPEAKIIHVACDVATEEGRQILFETTKQSVDRLHGLVNNVGINVRKSITEQTDEEYNKIMRTNIDSAYFLTRLLLNLFDTQNGATIVNVSSAAGVQSSGTGAAYGMSKAAMNQMTRSLACELARRNIRVNAVAPWQTMTPMLEEAVKQNPSQLDKVKAWTPLHRLAKPEEIAAPVVFLSMPCSSYITGQILGVDGGLTAQGFDGPCVTPE